MGTSTGVTFWHDGQNPESAKTIASRVFQEFERFDKRYSSYKPESDLSLVNRQAAHSPVVITEEFMTLIQQSFMFSELSGGLFDITYATVGAQYDYRQGVKPSSKALSQTLPLVSFKSIELDTQNTTFRFKQPGIKIDLGGIGKGFVVDQASQILQDSGVRDAAIFAGGDSRYLGMKDGQPWSVGIRHPRQSNETALVVPLANTAISTSGDYERFFIDDKGERHHHIIHPKTGVSPHELVSATVIANEAITADALSTSVLLAGVEDGLALIETLQNVDAILIDAKGKVHFSSGLVDPQGERLCDTC